MTTFTNVGSYDGGTTSGASFTFSPSAAVAVGDYVVLILGAAGTNTFTVSDSGSNTWSQLGLVQNTADTPLTTLGVYGCTITTALSTSSTITVGVGTNSPVNMLLLNAGTALGSSVGSQTGTGKGTAYATAAVSATAGDICLAATAVSMNGLVSTYTPGSGWTSLGGAGTGTRPVVAEEKTSAGGSETGAATDTNSSQAWSEFLIVWNPATAPAATPTVFRLDAGGVKTPVNITAL